VPQHILPFPLFWANRTLPYIPARADSPIHNNQITVFTIYLFFMHTIKTAELENSINSLENTFDLLINLNHNDLYYNTHANKSMIDFITSIKLCVNLLSELLEPYHHPAKSVYKLYPREIFKESLLRGIIPIDVYERFLIYGNNRNEISHNYYHNFIQETLPILPDFIQDARIIVEIVQKHNNTKTN